jgi:HSP20 family protein
MADLTRRSELFPMSELDPFRIVREMMRWDPFRAAFAMQDHDTWLPHFEVRENGNMLRVIADVPGVRRDDLEITVTGNRIAISGRREPEERTKGESMHAAERSYGQFVRTFVLPDSADIDHVTSELRDGVLTVVVPMKATAPTRKIPIGGANPKS